jgi:hypothetical protein
MKSILGLTLTLPDRQSLPTNPLLNSCGLHQTQG